jgi:hypothetical protein
VRGRLPHARLVLTVLIVAAAGLWAFEAWTLAPPSGHNRVAMTATVVGYELAPVPLWPAAYRGLSTFSAAERDALQAMADAQMARYATGGVLERWLGTDRPQGLLDSRRTSGGRISISARGRVVYYDFRGRFLDGRVVLRAAVEHFITSFRWSARGGPEDMHTRASPSAVIMEYTLAPVDGAWKVSGIRGWRFLDLASGRISYDPPSAEGVTP